MKNDGLIDQDECLVNEEWVNLDEVTLAAKLQLALDEEPFYKEASLPHKAFLAGRLLKKWDPNIRVTLDFMSVALEEDISKIEGWYSNLAMDKHPENRIAKKCIGKKLHLPKRYKRFQETGAR